MIRSLGLGSLARGLVTPRVALPTRSGGWVFQRTDDVMSALVLLLAIPVQLGCAIWVELALRAVWVLPVAFLLFLRSGVLVRVQPGHVTARRVVFGLPLPGRTLLRGPIRLERRDWEQDFGVSLPVVALVDESGGDIELRVQPGQEEPLREALACALERAGLPPTTF